MATIYRNVPGSGLYFITLEKTKSYLKSQRKFKDSSKNESFTSLIAGGFSRAVEFPNTSPIQSHYDTKHYCIQIAGWIPIHARFSHKSSI